ncbi:MAG: hypothetical protein P8X74_16020 [Reinekea sp.]
MTLWIQVQVSACPERWILVNGVEFIKNEKNIDRYIEKISLDEAIADDKKEQKLC